MSNEWRELAKVREASAHEGGRLGMSDGLDATAQHSALSAQHSSEGSTGARPGAVGFLTDTTLCIGCKACEVACKQWNQLPMDHFGFTAHSYDNTSDLGATTWRHVAFIEQLGDGSGQRPTTMQPFQSDWLMMSDICKHCVKAGCLEI